MRALLPFVIARVREPSTWAGLAAVLGVAATQETVQAVAQAASGVAAAIAILIPEARRP